MKKTVVLGASPNPSRYSYMAVQSLKDKGHEVVPVGIKDGDIAGENILKGMPEIEDVHTVSMYVGPAHQPEYYDYILGLKPERIIFNPGTLNEEFMEMATEKGIEAVDACNLVMLSAGTF